MNEVSQIPPFSVYGNSYPDVLSTTLQSMLSHLSDHFQTARPRAVRDVIACPPSRFWHRNSRSLILYTFLQRKLTLRVLDDIADLLVRPFIEARVLPDIRPIKAATVEELSNVYPDVFWKLSKTGVLLYRHECR